MAIGGPRRSVSQTSSPTDLQTYIDYKVKALNPGILTPKNVRLEMLHTNPIGCILLVVQDASAGSIPIITVIAAPSMATVSAATASDPAGILLANIWQESVLQPFSDLINLDQPHCPILAASEGFSRATTSPTPQLFLDDAKPMFFPAGELISEMVVLIANSGPTYRAFYLPETCSPPLGFCWPTDLSMDDFFESLKLLGSSYKIFMQTLEAIKPALAVWFDEVSANPTAFAILVCSYSSITQAFPAILDGTYPNTIIHPRGFSPLMDMQYGLAWRLHCDQVLTTTTGPALQHFSTFLQRGTVGITPPTYFHAAIPGRFCPNFGYHFKPHNQVWPTLADPIEHFKSPSLVSLEAQDYDPVIIKVHGNHWAPIRALLTCDERSTERHCASTPRHT
jgi:hypothetical protein